MFNVVIINYLGRKVTIVPPVRSDSLQNNYGALGSVDVAPEVTASDDRVQVQVLTHNGSVSSEA